MASRAGLSGAERWTNGPLLSDAGTELELVVGVDFSEGAAVAVAEARRLAGQIGRDPHFVHVVEEGVEAPKPVEIGAWLRAHELESSAIEIVLGVAWIELGRVAVSHGSRLVVIGSHGRSGFQPLKPGRTAMQLTLRSPIPVLVVPAGRSSSAGSKVGFVEHVPEGFRRLGVQ